jgi:hypothetical protein
MLVARNAALALAREPIAKQPSDEAGRLRATNKGGTAGYASRPLMGREF